jgi:hypothetical protein
MYSSYMGVAAEHDTPMVIHTVTWRAHPDALARQDRVNGEAGWDGRQRLHGAPQGLGAKQRRHNQPKTARGLYSLGLPAMIAAVRGEAFMADSVRDVLAGIATVGEMTAAFQGEDHCRWLLEATVWPRGRICPACGYRCLR